MRSNSACDSIDLRTVIASISRQRSARPGWASLLVLGAMVAIGSVPVAEAQDFGPNFASACGESLVVVQGVHPDSTGTRMVLTDGGRNESSAVFCPVPTYGDGSFATAFTFQLTDALADGFTLAIVAAPNTPGSEGGGLGYEGIPHSVALKFDLYNNASEGANSSGVYVEGAPPTVPAMNLTGTGIDLHSGHPINAVVTYKGSLGGKTLDLALTDTVTRARWAHAFAVDIESIVNWSPTADSPYLYNLGFTAGTGSLAATQQILKWNTASVYQPVGFPAGDADFVTGSKPGAIAITTPIGAKAVPLGTSNVLTLADGGKNEGSAVFYARPVSVKEFTSDFTFQITNAFVSKGVGPVYYPPLKGGQGDGFTFAILGSLPSPSIYTAASPVDTVGGPGGGLGYHGIVQQGPDLAVTIPKSAAIKFDLYDNGGEGPNSTGLFVNGAYPTVPAIDLTASGIDLHTPDRVHAHISYDGAMLKLILTDIDNGAQFYHSFPINLPSVLGSSTGYAGFTAGTGGMSSTIQILNWSYWGGLADTPQ